MPDYKLKNGEIVTVKEEDVQSFMGSKHSDEAVLIEVENALVTDAETIDADFQKGSALGADALPKEKPAPMGTVLDSVNGSLESVEKSDPADGFIIKATKSEEFKKKEENANKLRNRISKVTPLSSKGEIGFEYLGYEDKGGYIAPKLSDEDRPYEYVKFDADGQKQVYTYGVPGPLDGYNKQYKNTFEEDLKNKLGDSRYQQVKKAFDGAAAKGINLTRENLGEFIDLSLIPQSVQNKIVDGLQSNAADAFVQTLDEQERMDVTSFLGTDSFKKAVRLDKEAKQKDADDYKRQYGKTLIGEQTVMDLDTRETRTFTPVNTSFLNITGKSDLGKFKKIAENVYEQDQKDISKIVENFNSTYEN